MKKKSLLLVVALLALSGLMASMAFTSAWVKDKMTLSVVNTNEALIALEPGNHNAAYYVDNAKGIGPVASTLRINLNRGKDGVEYGMQRNSRYQWDELFKVTNNSENTVKVTVSLDKKGGPEVSMKTGSSWSNGPQTTFTLKSGESKYIDLYVYTRTENWVTPTSYNWTMRVSASIAE
jgi:hypothetical protein